MLLEFVPSQNPDDLRHLRNMARKITGIILLFRSAFLHASPFRICNILLLYVLQFFNLSLQRRFLGAAIRAGGWTTNSAS
jgi:hypothetical protein